MKPQLVNVKPQSMELKYCERCGNIWLRPRGADSAHCTRCARAEAAIAQGPGAFLQVWSRFRAEVQA